MCGQFYILKHLKQKTIYPSDMFKIMIYENKHFGYSQAQWGFSTRHQRVINAKSETLLTKPMFKGLRHCLILANGYYEWDGAKMKTDIHLPKYDYLYMAGVCRMVKDHLEYVIITTKANESVVDIHHRMPLIFDKKDAELWLKDEKPSLLEIIPQSLETTQLISQTHFDI